MTDEIPFDDDDDRALLLAAWDEALRRGDVADTNDNSPDITTADPRLRRGLHCLRMLERVYRPAEPDSAEVAADVQSIGRFHVEKMLGYGGFGIVYLATDPVLRRQVALKVPRLPHLIEPQQRDRFLREAQTAAALSHPNLIPVFEAGEADGLCYLAAEYCDGPTLAEWADTASSRRSVTATATGVSPQTAAEIVRQLAMAVAHAHEQGVLHRDIKPTNVLLDQRRGSGLLPFVPRLTDFGLAKMAEAPPGSHTVSGAILGTPKYMAPEQAAGENSRIGPATDIYSLGVLLYELLAGCTPFSGDNPAQTVQRVLHGTPALLSELAPGTPAALAATCHRCLQRNPAERYATALELADALQDFLGGSLAVAERAPHRGRRRHRSENRGVGDSAPATLRKGTRSTSIIALGGALLAVAFAVAAIVLVMQTDRGELSIYREVQGVTAEVKQTGRAHAADDPDLMIGEGGIVLTEMFANASGRPGSVSFAVATQSNGKTVVAGETENGFSDSNMDMTVTRYNVNGTLDTSFGGGGTVTIDFGSSSRDQAEGIAIDAEGKIVVVGSSANGSNSDFAVARLDSNGTLLWKRTIPIGIVGADNAYAVAIQGTKIVVVGSTHNGNNDDVGVVRCDSNGIPDSTFGTLGKKVLRVGSGLDARRSGPKRLFLQERRERVLSRCPRRQERGRSA